MKRLNVFGAAKILSAFIVLGILLHFSLRKDCDSFIFKCEQRTDRFQYPDIFTMKPSSQHRQFNVILTFRLINDSVHGEVRMKEYLWTLGQFLENGNVKQVHLMVDSQHMSQYVQKNIQKYIGLSPNPNSEDSQTTKSAYYQKDKHNEIPHLRLKLHQVDHPDKVLTLHQFAFTHFQGELVVITQADILFGEGFEKVNRALLAGNRILYSLSRHESKCGTLKDQCEDYSGSHDTFVFVPDGDITHDAKRLLNHTIFSYGTENLVMYVYQHLLQYKVLNPCRILRTYHFHCTNYRKYKRVQKWVLHERSKPVDRLV